MTKNKNNYKDSGVDVDQGQKFVEDIKKLTSKSQHSFSLGGIGGFSGYIEAPSEFVNPVYALACDGVGTKMRLALQTNDLTTIGIDLVAMCVNDLIVSGAKPLAFLDYYGCSNLDREKAKEIVSGIIDGCNLAGCELVGGETAEMPNHYQGNNFDLVGFSLGINEKANIISGNEISSGDIILALPSSGFHSNGFSLINSVISQQNIADDFFKELLTPTRIYVNEVLDLINKCNVKGMAHITGGGLHENLSRLTPNYTMCINKDSWDMPAIFSTLQKVGNISSDEMLNVFNCGIGYCIVLDRENADKAMSENTELFEIGYVDTKSDQSLIFV